MRDDGTAAEYFSEVVPRDVLEELQELAGSDHVITALELMAANAALQVWGRRCRYRRLFLAVDNEAARAALVKSASTAPALRKLVRLVLDQDAAFPNYRWVLRVPSSSNQADDPSRLDLRKLVRQRAQRKRLKWADLKVGKPRS